MATTDEVEEFAGDVLGTPEPVSTSAAIDSGYYTFENYVSKTRMLTFYHQLAEVLSAQPANVLEIGIGARVVAGTLREIGVPLTTVDINSALTPDHVGSVLDLEEICGAKSFDVVLCARVLHHLSYAEFETALEQLKCVAKRRVVLTLPVDEVRVYLGLRRTAGAYRILSLKLPLSLKTALKRLRPTGEKRYSQLWKVDSHPLTRRECVLEAVNRYFMIEKSFQVPEDQSHLVLVLRPRK